MLAQNLRENLPKLIRAKNISYTQFEEEAGLHKNYISNFIASDAIPRIDIVARIADTLKVSIDELIGREAGVVKGLSLPTENTKLILELMDDCFTTIKDLLEEKNLEISFNRFMYLVKEMYLYCLFRNEKTLDKRFASWFIYHSLQNEIK